MHGVYKFNITPRMLKQWPEMWQRVLWRETQANPLRDSAEDLVLLVRNNIIHAGPSFEIIRVQNRSLMAALKMICNMQQTFALRMKIGNLRRKY